MDNHGICCLGANNMGTLFKEFQKFCESLEEGKKGFKCEKGDKRYTQLQLDIVFSSFSPAYHPVMVCGGMTLGDRKESHRLDNQHVKISYSTEAEGQHMGSV